MGADRTGAWAANKTHIVGNSQASVGVFPWQGKLAQRRQDPGRAGLPPPLLPTEASAPGSDSSDQVHGPAENWQGTGRGLSSVRQVPKLAGIGRRDGVWAQGATNGVCWDFGRLPGIWPRL